jgi:hypothetical protein
MLRVARKLRKFDFGAISAVPSRSAVRCLAGGMQPLRRYPAGVLRAEVEQLIFGGQIV